MSPHCLAGRFVGVFFLASALPPFVAAQAPTGADATVTQTAPIDPLSVPRPSLRALRIERPVRIDGRLDEPEWAAAEPTDRPERRVVGTASAVLERRFTLKLTKLFAL